MSLLQFAYVIQTDSKNFSIKRPIDDNGNIIKPIFKVKEKTVREVLAGINELIREDKKSVKIEN